MAALLGMLTGIGGGMLRDVLANEVPTVLRADLYALVALAAAAVVVIGHALHVQPLATTSPRLRRRLNARAPEARASKGTPNHSQAQRVTTQSVSGADSRVAALRA